MNIRKRLRVRATLLASRNKLRPKVTCKETDLSEAIVSCARQTGRSLHANRVRKGPKVYGRKPFMPLLGTIAKTPLAFGFDIVEHHSSDPLHIIRTCSEHEFTALSPEAFSRIEPQQENWMVDSNSLTNLMDTAAKLATLPRSDNEQKD